MKAPFALAVVALVVALFACNEGQPLLVGADEPIRVRGAQFIAGALPGTPPADGGADAGPPQGLAVVDVSAVNAIAAPGQANKKFSGHTTDVAVAVGMRIADVGSGYWVLPIGPPDPQYPGQLTWDANVDFSLSFPAGNHMLRVVALDASGNASGQVDFRVCASSRIPDNYNACNPAAAPPEAVITLMWDADVDLDLEVTTPDGTLVSPKGQPTTVLVDAGRPGPDVGVIDRDSLVACVPDGLRQENLVWQQRPKGTFSVRVNVFDACKKPGATFQLVVYEPTGTGTARHLEETFRRAGHVTELDANGGAALGLFIVDYPFGD